MLGGLSLIKIVLKKRKVKNQYHALVTCNILQSSSVQWNMAKVAKIPGRGAIWFDTAAITLKTKEQANYTFLFYC